MVVPPAPSDLDPRIERVVSSMFFDAVEREGAYGFTIEDRGALRDWMRAFAMEVAREKAGQG